MNVVLLHGLFRRPRSMSKLAAALRARGHAVHPIGYPSMTSPYRELVRHVAHELREMRLDGAAGLVAFACHSLGGLLWRDLGEELEGFVSGPCVLFGTPLRGSIVARSVDGELAHRVLGPAIGELAAERDDEPRYPGPFATVICTRWSPLVPAAPLLRAVAGKEPSDSTVLVREARSVHALETLEVHRTHTFLPNDPGAIEFAADFIARHAPEAAGAQPGATRSVRNLPKLPTAGGRVFWSDVAEGDGWRIQYNRLLEKASPLKPFRLLDPQDYLCASADSAEELVAALPRLVAEYSVRSPAIGSDQVARILSALRLPAK